jgi:hypothetical protein
MSSQVQGQPPRPQLPAQPAQQRLAAAPQPCQLQCPSPAPQHLAPTSLAATAAMWWCWTGQQAVVRSASRCCLQRHRALRAAAMCWSAGELVAAAMAAAVQSWAEARKRPSLRRPLGRVGGQLQGSWTWPVTNDQQQLQGMPMSQQPPQPCQQTSGPAPGQLSSLTPPSPPSPLHSSSSQAARPPARAPSQNQLHSLPWQAPHHHHHHQLLLQSSCLWWTPQGYHHQHRRPRLPPSRPARRPQQAARPPHPQAGMAPPVPCCQPTPWSCCRLRSC